MTVDEALELSDEWIKNVPMPGDIQGWRVACHTLATEVRQLRIERDAIITKCAAIAQSYHHGGTCQISNRCRPCVISAAIKEDFGL